MWRSKASVVISNAAPWLGFAAAMWVQVAAGNTYSYPLYSNKIKTKLNYSQWQLNNLGVAVDIGQNVGLLAGFMCNKLPAWAFLLIGSFACFLGHGIVWLVMKGAIASLPFSLIWIAQLVGSNSSTWMITAALITNMRNFPESRGSVSGILKGLSGIGGAVFTSIFTCFLDRDPIKLLLFIALGPLVICLLVMYFVRRYTSTAKESKEQKHLAFLQWTTVLLAIYLLATTIAENVLSCNSTLLLRLIGVIMVILIMSPVIVPLKVALETSGYILKPSNTHVDSQIEPLLEREEKNPQQIPDSPGNVGVPVSCNPDICDLKDGTNQQQTYYKGNSSSSSSREGEDSMRSKKLEGFQHVESDVQILLAEGEGAVARKKRKPRRGDDFNLRQALVKADFWLLFGAYFCGVGSGITFLNNLAQIGIAQGYEDVALLLSIIGVCNFHGRLGGGTLSEYYVRLWFIPRPFWMAATQFLMIFCFLFIATAIPRSLPFCSFVLGLCFGVQSAIMVPTASEVFGLKHFGMIYNFLTMANPLGALLFSSFLAGYIYDKEAEKQAGGHVCVGSNCFKLTFFIMAVVTAIGVCLSAILTKRLWPVYDTLYGKSSFRISREIKDECNV